MFRFFEKIFGNTLYYPGCLTRYVLPEIEENYKAILKKMGIDFITLPELSCCGSPAMHAGYKGDFNELKKRNAVVFSKYGVSRIITNCPACFRVLSDSGFRVEHITQLIAKNLKKVTARHSGQITYHDPCHLGRHSGVYDEPRVILRHIGFELLELPDNRERSLCCGAGAGMKTNYPLLSNKIAKQLLSNAKTDIVTTCPMCYKHLKENASGINVIELSELLN